MKHLNSIRFSLFLFLVLILSSVLSATEHDNLIPEILKPEMSALKSANMFNDFSTFSEAKLSIIEDNLIRGIKSDNAGLQTSCAYFLGEMKSSKAMIPLLKLAKTWCNRRS